MSWSTHLVVKVRVGVGFTGKVTIRKVLIGLRHLTLGDWLSDDTLKR